MKRGELIILWAGALLSVALLILSEAPSPIDQKVSLSLGGYIVNLLARLAAIWIICGLVWLTLYRRDKGD